MLLLEDQRPRSVYPVTGSTRDGEECVILLELIGSDRIMRYVARLRQSFPEYQEAEIVALLLTVGGLCNRKVAFVSEEVAADPVLVEAVTWYRRVFELNLAGRLIVHTGRAYSFEYVLND